MHYFISRILKHNILVLSSWIFFFFFSKWFAAVDTNLISALIGQQQTVSSAQVTYKEGWHLRLSSCCLKYLWSVRQPFHSQQRVLSRFIPAPWDLSVFKASPSSWVLPALWHAACPFLNLSHLHQPCCGLSQGHALSFASLTVCSFKEIFCNFSHSISAQSVAIHRRCFLVEVFNGKMNSWKYSCKITAYSWQHPTWNLPGGRYGIQAEPMPVS